MEDRVALRVEEGMGSRSEEGMASLGTGAMVEEVVSTRTEEEKSVEEVAIIGTEEGTMPEVGEGRMTAMTGTKKRAVDLPELVVGKMPIVPSQYIVSPFTAETKRRRFVDGTIPNLFREVDHVK